MKPNITIHQIDPRGPSVTVMLGDGYAVPTVSGGWGDTARERDSSIAEWAGKALATLDVPIMLDRFTDEVSVEPQVGTLFGFVRNTVGPRNEPPVLRITGVPLPFSNLVWVLNGITPGDEIRREKDGQRVRAGMVLSFLEYREGDIVVSRRTSPAKKKQRESKSEHWVAVNVAQNTHTYTVHNGDTLQSIAAKLLGSSNRWHDLAKLNGIRDPKNIKVGQKLKVPKQ